MQSELETVGWHGSLIYCFKVQMQMVHWHFKADWLFSTRHIVDVAWRPPFGDGDVIEAEDKKSVVFQC